MEMVISLVFNVIQCAYNILKKRYETSRWKYRFVYKVREPGRNIQLVINTNGLFELPQQSSKIVKNEDQAS